MDNARVGLWTDQSSDAELIAGVRAGESAAFGVLFERHGSAARRVAAMYSGVPSDVDDIVSEAFARVLKALQQGDGPDMAFRAYLFTVVRRTGLDTIAKGKRTRLDEDMTTHDKAIGYEKPSDEPALDSFEQGVVADAFKSLPERWQVVLWYTEIEKKSPGEVAPLLGPEPERRRRARLSRARGAPPGVPPTAPRHDRQPRLPRRVRTPRRIRPRRADQARAHEGRGPRQALRPLRRARERTRGRQPRAPRGDRPALPRLDRRRRARDRASRSAGSAPATSRTRCRWRPEGLAGLRAEWPRARVRARSRD